MISPPRNEWGLRFGAICSVVIYRLLMIRFVIVLRGGSLYASLALHATAFHVQILQRNDTLETNVATLVDDESRCREQVR
mmetsp:Transcript_32732/g.104207  ORF Transcript_32732/g.104207 Transcript_32732/m.104207 type:complete len:80 (+) Transcript_32732:145-384(+)